MRICENCKAEVPEGRGGNAGGSFYCCIHCAFHPLGCRCQYGEFGVEETQHYWYPTDEELEDVEQ